jgi:hypothetical protein
MILPVSVSHAEREQPLVLDKQQRQERNQLPQ